MGEMRPYIVRQGDYLAKIAFEQGFDADEVWKHEKNKGLKEQGRSPEILHPGDLLMIPEKDAAPTSANIQARNRYQADVAMTSIKVSLRGDEGKPVAGAPYVVEGFGDPTPANTDGQGTISVEVPVTCKTVFVVLPEMGRRLRFDVGHLDPSAEESGARARLSQLGLLHPLRGTDARRDAIEHFQQRERLAVTGDLDDDTRSKLEQSHGS